MNTQLDMQSGIVRKPSSIGQSRESGLFRVLLAICLLLSGAIAISLPAQAQTTPITVPSAPQNLSATSGDGNVTLAWQAPSDNGGADIIRYNISFMRINIGVYDVGSVEGLTATVDGLTNGWELYFRVAAENSAGVGPSAIANVRVTDVPDAPTNLSAKPRNGKVRLAWGRPDDNGGISLTGFQYRYAEGASVPATTRWRSAGYDEKVTVNGLTNGTAYAFEVRARNRRGAGAAAEISATPATVPSAPQNLAATPGDGEVALAWQAPGDDGGSAVTRYQYRHAEGASVPEGTAWTSVKTDLTVTVGSLTNGTAHAFEVRARNRRGASAAAEISATPATVPSAPQNLEAKPADGEAILAWQAPGDDGGSAVTGYQYRYAEGASVPAATSWRSAGTDLTVTVRNLTNGTAHAFEVRARNRRGGGAKAEIAATPAAVPSAPQNLEAMPGDGGVRLTWQAPGDDGGVAVVNFQYRYAEGASVPEETAWTSVGTDLAAMVGSLTNGTAYAFEVRATSRRGDGAVAEVSATPATVPSAPQNLAATPGDGAVRLAWQAPGDDGGFAVTGYQYRYAEGASVPAATTWRSVGTDLAATVGSLTNGAAHAFEVRAVSAKGEGPAARVQATPEVVGDGTNTDPTVANAIPDQTTPSGTVFRYTFPANTFSDADSGDTLSYTAAKSDGSALPAWLRFAPSIQTFSGTPRGVDLGTVTVKVTASDGNGGSASDEFDITVLPGTFGRLELSVEMVDEEVTEGEPVRYRIVMSKPTDWVSVGKRYDYQGRFMYSEPTSSIGDIRSENGRLYWEVELATVDDGKVESDGTYTVTLQPGPDYWLGSPSRATVRILDNDVPELAHAQVSVDDAWVEEGPGAVLEFPVTLDRARSTTVTVDWRTLDGSARAGSDYEAGSGTLAFHPGETAKTVRIGVLDDAHDEGRENMLVVLSNPSGADMDGEGTVAVGTIENSDAMPGAWIARFGRTVAGQVLEAVEGRIGSAPRPGVEATLAGQRIDAARKSAEADAREAEERAQMERLASWLSGPAEADRRSGSRAVAPRELLARSSFALTADGDDAGGGIASLWGRGAVSSFDSREGELSLSGEVVSAMAGADWTSGGGSGADSWTAGLIVSHSRGEGSYRGASDSGSVSSTLTGLFPWGRHALNERLSIWGVAGYGEGVLTLTPAGEASIRSDLDLTMVSSGLRGVLVQAPETGGLELAVKTDGLLVRTNSAGAPGLVAATGDATRFRLAVEGSRPFRFEDGVTLSPSAELGVRHDGGDAENGFGLDLGGGLAWSHPASGMSAELRGRGLLTHESRGFRIRGIRSSLAWDPDPASDRGPSLALVQSVGASAAGGMNALLGRETLAGLAANNSDAASRNPRLELKGGYGFSALGGRSTSKAEVGIGFGQDHREYTLGWSLGTARSGPAALEFGLEASRREHAGENADPEHGIGLRVEARW